MWGKVENHFQDLDRVDGAFRAENGKLYLFCDTQFIRYSAALEPGNTAFYVDEGYPRRMSVWWAGEGTSLAMPNVWNALGSAVLRDAQATYAFDGATYKSSASPTPAPVIPTWARVRNEMQTQNRVDAGFVFGSGASATTLLFSADQYVRYSGAYSGFVDEGYPKVIAHLAAADGAFPGIPSELLQGVRGFFSGTDGALHVFAPAPASDAAPQLYVSSASGDSLRPLNQRWGIIDNQLWDNEFVDAALRTTDGKLFLFSGDQYLRYSSADRSNVDEGYPRKISTSYAAELGVASLAPEMNAGVDAALIVGTTHFYFVGSNVISSAAPTTAVSLVSRWGLVRNFLQESGRLDAAFVAPNGKLHLFAGNQYAVYSGASRTYVDEEFPRVIAGDIGQAWPSAFTQNLTAAAGFEGRSYLFQGSSHVRISDYRLRLVDAGYPIANSEKFLERFDFELGHLPLWWQAKQLFDDHSDTTPSLLEYVDTEVASDQTEALARATQWPSDTIAALLLIYGLAEVDLLDLGTLSQLARALELAERVGSTPKKLKSEFWDRVFGASPAPVASLTQAADYLFQLIKATTSSQEFVTVARDLYNVVANAKRDALVAYLITHQIGNSALPAKLDANDVYEYLLTDVQRDASLDTSYVVEAINSIQLFYHRALMGLEPSVPAELVDNLRLWWPWMKNYRIWEANRKVFLHPENYIRPELRTEKSPAFEELEQKLLQDEITATSVRAAYQKYLEAFHEIGRLRIVGGYRYEHLIELEGSSGGTTETATQIAVFMIGVSRTEPLVYYYRFGALQPPRQDQDPDTTNIDWDPWQKVGITINAPRVQPVYAFNRLFLFWIESEPYNSTEFSSGDDKTYSASSEGTKQVQLTVKYSFYNFTKEWAAPQSVRLNPGDATSPEALPHIFSASIA
ncbi:MAG TPA: neuraminidase-like domain-containing protein, partial [Polyangiaceae bacterium]|nr:neuraminidase-like domain-containing protein [Polyangiaceae bacterium]